ncbi:hypothetical protein [Peribacillus sp. NPDC096540]|uniref:hypothetical protein n=1 Tax=Peribacillus sp. NPDC096540 TaxID=3390612 RepID=UPI003D005AAB
MLQDRFTGDAGNLSVLHGIVFHALHINLARMAFRKSKSEYPFKKLLIYYGSIAWMLSIILIGFQTA